MHDNDPTRKSSGSTSERPMVSVIVPAYNSAEFIESAVRSILEQHYENLEIIIVNDRSSDDTWEKIGRLAADHAQIRRCQNERAQGPSGARNTGLDLATGEYIAFLDADDVWLPGHLDHGIDFFARNPDMGVVFFNFDVIDLETGEHLGDWFTRGKYLRKLKTLVDQQGYEIIDDDVFGTLIREAFFHLQSMVIRRRTCGRLRFDENIMHAEDRDFAIKLCIEARAGFAFKDVVTGIYYRHDNSLTTGSPENSLDRLSSHIYLYSGYLEKYDLSAEHRSLIKDGLFRRYLSSSYSLRKLDRYGDALRALRRGSRYGPNHEQTFEMLKLMLEAMFYRFGARRANAGAPAVDSRSPVTTSPPHPWVKR